MKIRIKVFLISLSVLACLLLTGCGASVTAYDYTSGGVRYFAYRVEIDRAVVDKAEQSAAEFDGVKYTVPQYLYSLFSGFGYSVDDAKLDEESFTAIYSKATDKPELYSVGCKPEFEYADEQNPFIRYITATAPNPYNGVRKAYDEVLPGQSSNVIQQLKNGRVAIDEYGTRIILFPSITDAFPYLKQLNIDGLLLEYAYNGSPRMKSSGETDGKGMYVFSRYFDTSDTSVVFEYKRPVAYGWYLVAIAAGGIVLAVILLVTRERKQKPTLLDRFPYNPETYRDYDSHLPMKK